MQGIISQDTVTELTCAYNLTSLACSYTFTVRGKVASYFDCLAITMIAPHLNM